VLLADMAGLRDTADPVESEGVRRAVAWAGSADRRLWVVDGSGADEWRAACGLVEPGDLCVLNKVDAPEGEATAAVRRFAAEMGLDVLPVALALDGTPRIRAWLVQALLAELGAGEFPAATSVRHRESLLIRRALGALNRPELATEDVRLASRALLRITGAIGSEDVLDRVFAAFCIGK
jgi:tRNA modification GTPase